MAREIAMVTAMTAAQISLSEARSNNTITWTDGTSATRTGSIGAYFRSRMSYAAAAGSVPIGSVGTSPALGQAPSWLLPNNSIIFISLHFAVGQYLPLPTKPTNKYMISPI